MQVHVQLEMHEKEKCHFACTRLAPTFALVLQLFLCKIAEVTLCRHWCKTKSKTTVHAYYFACLSSVNVLKLVAASASTLASTPWTSFYAYAWLEQKSLANNLVGRLATDSSDLLVWLRVQFLAFEFAMLTTIPVVKRRTVGQWFCELLSRIWLYHKGVLVVKSYGP